MDFISAVSTQVDFEDALKELIQQTLSQAGEEKLDLAIVFTTAQFTHAIREIVTDLRAALQPGLLIGCTAEGVIERDREIENDPGIVLLSAHLPQVELNPFILQADSLEWARLLLDQDEFTRRVAARPDTRLFLLLGDPFSTPMDDLLRSFNLYYPGVPALGGMASGALRPGGNLLFVNDQVTNQGVVGVAVSGAVDIDVVVSQGCRPIWRPFRVAACRQNEIYELEGRSPLAWLQDLIPTLPEEDRALLQTGLFVGKSVKPGQELLGRGDFVIRGVVGIDQENGAIAIGDSVMDGEIIQFHLRDASTAQEDLEMQLIPQMFRERASGGLLFLCNGRGTHLYENPNTDIGLIQPSIKNIPLAGFFCAGEIGPIGGVNYLHGHTAALALFRPTA
ncbi:MAG: FIST signal transduction protein [Anaerolineales bacterium]